METEHSCEELVGSKDRCNGKRISQGIDPAPPNSLPTITKENETLNKPEEWGMVGVEVEGSSPPQKAQL